MGACPECEGRGGRGGAGAACQSCGRVADDRREPVWARWSGDDTLVDIERHSARVVDIDVDVDVDEVGGSPDGHSIDVHDDDAPAVHLVEDGNVADPVEPCFESSTPDVVDGLEPFPPLPRSAAPSTSAVGSTPVAAPPRGSFTTTPTQTITRVLGERELLLARIASGLELPPSARPASELHAAVPAPRPLFGAETPLPRAVQAAPESARAADPEVRDARPPRTLPRTVPLWIWGAAALLALVVGVTAGWLGASSRGAARRPEVTTPSSPPTSSSSPAPRPRSSRSSK